MNRTLPLQYIGHYLSDNFFAYHIDMYREQGIQYPLNLHLEGSYLPLDLHVCLYCHKKGNLRCARCKNVYFCSPVCQRRAWTIHKRHCGRDLFSVCAACGVSTTLMRCIRCPARFCSTECFGNPFQHEEEECQGLAKLFPVDQVHVILDLSGDELTTLKDCFFSPDIQGVNVSRNPLTNLVGCPESVIKLICNACDLSSFEGCPPGTKLMSCSINRIASLAGAPSQLEELDISHNQLTSLQGCPASLLHLSCSSNQLTSLAGISSNLVTLQCDDNQLTSLEGLPFSVREISFKNNPLSPEWEGKTLEQIHALNREKKIYRLRTKMAARTIQRAWAKYWFIPNAEGEARYARRSYDVLTKAIPQDRKGDVHLPQDRKGNS